MSQEARGNSGPVTQIATVNQIGKYIWPNKDTWVAVKNNDGTFKVDVAFVADSPLVPHQSCFSISTDAKITQLMSDRQGMAFSNIIFDPPFSDLPSKNYKECGDGYTANVNYSVRFSTKPTFIEASLVESK